MQYKGYTITAEVTAYEIFSLNADGSRDEYIESSLNSGDITGYFFDNDKTGDSFFETTGECDQLDLEWIVDDRLKVLAK